MSVRIEASAVAGDAIGPTCQELCDLAARIAITVECRFNGVLIIVRPGDSPRAVESAWWKAVESGHEHKVAVVR